MALTALTETGHGPEFLLSEAPGYRSRDNVIFAVSQTISAGEVIAKVTEGVKTATPANGVPAPAGATISAVTAALNAEVGVHTFRCIVGGAGAASKWEHRDPSGDFVGVVTTGTAYAAGGLSALTITDTGTDPTVGEAFIVTVTSATASGQWKTHDPEAVDGTQNAAGIAYQAVTTGGSVTAPGVAITRDAEVISARLTWDDQDTTEKAAAVVQLTALGIIVRT